jgi:hypothetical protein
MVVRTGGTFLCVCVLALAGCGARPELASGKAIAPKTPQAATGTWAGENRGSSITLSLRDGRFQAIFKGGEWRSVVKGKARLEDSAVVLEAREFNGEPATKANEQMPARFTYSADWATLTSEDGLALNRKL